MNIRVVALAMVALAVAAVTPMTAGQAPATQAEPSGIFIEVPGQAARRLSQSTSDDVQTKGIAKMMLTQGLSKPKFVVTHPGASAGVVVTDSRPAFIFRFGPKMNSRNPSAMFGGFDADGLPPITDNPKDFTLARMTVDAGARLIDTGKIDKWNFDVQEMKPREFRLTLKAPLAAGEYAFFYGKNGGMPTQIWAFAYTPAQ